MKISEYVIRAPQSLTVAAVSDLHGTDPKPVLDAIRSVHPDVIAVCGDIFNIDEDVNKSPVKPKIEFPVIYYPIFLIDRLFRLIRPKPRRFRREYSYHFLLEAGKIAPVLMAPGNHDINLSAEDFQVIKESGTILLRESAYRINNFLFGGIPSKTGDEAPDEFFLKQFSSEKGFKILLSHHPEYYDKLKSYSPDLIISGHAHGGQICLFGHGLFAPGQGFFPKYFHGIYDNKMIVTSGCANTSSIPRWGNPCEIVLIKLIPSRD